MTSNDPEKIIICSNRRAKRDYQIEDTIEAGLALTGTEVKSLRRRHADLKDSYAGYREGEMFLIGAHIAAYERATHFNHDPLRERKLLLKKRAIVRLGVKIRERGYTLVPLELYFKNGWAKVLLGLAKGRKQYDRRAAIRAREELREIRRAAQENRDQ